ncbi:hypothetical protein MKS88_003837 [Plasmodium brasilianum]|uniref:Uncharacterized protein n=1 Tax=Plasmodium brasilianum TaxID=5824 RepID=A0ACB9Y8G4_PLABR|nr:hypothetical protein MKS88_003837 [Plasmodium brasilianum]
MKYSAFKNSLRFASKFYQNNSYKLYMNSVPQFSTFTYGKHIKTSPLTNRLDDLLKKNASLISIISVNGLDDLIMQSSKIGELFFHNLIAQNSMSTLFFNVPKRIGFNRRLVAEPCGRVSMYDKITPLKKDVYFT